MSEKSILNDLQLTGGEGTVVAVSIALLREETFLAVSHTLSLVDGSAPSLNMYMSKNYSTILVGTRGDIFLYGTILSLDLIAQRVEASTVGKLDVTKEVSGLGLKVPIGKDLINTVEVGLPNSESAGTCYVIAVRIEVPWDVLSQVVNGLSQSINKILIRVTLLGESGLSYGHNHISRVSWLRRKRVSVVVLEAQLKALIGSPLSVTLATISAERDAIRSGSDNLFLCLHGHESGDAQRRE
jgi:hypothetical protein